MRTHTFEIPEAEWPTCKQRSREWEKRVNIAQWVHDFDKKMYLITINVKK